MSLTEEEKGKVFKEAVLREVNRLNEDFKKERIMFVLGGIVFGFLLSVLISYITDFLNLTFVLVLFGFFSLVSVLIAFKSIKEANEELMALNEKKQLVLIILDLKKEKEKLIKEIKKLKEGK